MVFINEEKLNKIKLEKQNYFVAIDFDRTITSKDSLDSWAAAANKEVLGNKIIEEQNKLYQIYYPIELDYTIDIEEKRKSMIEWYNKCMDLYYEHELTKEKLEKSIDMSNINFRKGAKEFLNTMNERQIPVIILSAGIGNVIQRFLTKNNCYYKNIHIISNFIKFNEDGTMKKFNDNMIHTLNKTMQKCLHQEWNEKISNKEYGLLIGDLIEDKNMIQEENWDKTILVGFLNNKIEENQKMYEEKFDIVLSKENATFDNIRKILVI